MHCARRMVWMRILLSAPLATASIVGLGFSISGASGLACTGTLSRNSTLAAADLDMALTGPAPGVPIGVESGVTLVDFSGMVMVSPQVGHLICSPAPSASTDNSCSQCGQLK